MSTLYMEALKLSVWGWCILPVAHGQKEPSVAWKQMQDRLPTDDELHRWFDGDDCGMAVVCGAVSGDLACLDFDKPGAYELWASNNPELAAKLPTDTREDSGRYHVFVRLERTARSSEMFIPGYEGKAGEFICEKKLAVLPPTLHAEGNRRQWVIEPTASIPVLALEALGLVPPAVVHVDQMGGRLISEKIGEGCRHSRLTQIAAKMRGAGHGTGFIHDVVAAVNDSRCQPPLGRLEVEGIARWAGRLPAGVIHPLARTRDDEAGGSTTTIITPLSLGDDDAQRYRELFRACPEYLRENGEEMDWLVEGMLPVDYLVVVGGTSKAGKSCLATSLAMAVSTGAPFLEMPTKQSAVLWCAYEESEQERAMVLREYPAAPDSLYITHEKLYIDSAEGIDALRWWVRQTGAGLIVVDPLYGANRADSLSDGRKAREVLSGLKELCRTERVCAVVLHHFTKNVGAGITRERFADSNQILATASMDVLMDATEGDDGSRDIRLQGRGRGSFANRTWFVRSTGVTDFQLVSEGSAGEQDAAHRDRRVLEALRSSDEPLTADALSNRTGMHLPTLRNRLTAMVREGLVVQAGMFGRAHLYRAVETQLAPEQMSA